MRKVAFFRNVLEELAGTCRHDKQHMSGRIGPVSLLEPSLCAASRSLEELRTRGWTRPPTHEWARSLGDRSYLSHRCGTLTLDCYY